MAANPVLRINLSMDDHQQDLVREGLDVALRFGPLADSNATTRFIGNNRLLLVASPAYHTRAGIPASPADLAGHALIVGPPGSTPKGWTFECQGHTQSVRAEGALTLNTNEAVAAAVNGLGIISTGFWGCRAELNNGSLVEVLKDWKMETSKLYAVFPASAATKTSAKAFINYLIAELNLANHP